MEHIDFLNTLVEGVSFTGEVDLGGHDILY
jgi:hypothetical protein